METVEHGLHQPWMDVMKCLKIRRAVACANIRFDKKGRPKLGKQEQPRIRSWAEVPRKNHDFLGGAQITFLDEDWLRGLKKARTLK